MLIACVDVTERRLNELRVLHISRHDALTNLPNRSLLNERLESLVAEHEPFALMFLDLDKFKVVNDSLGHGVGDELLMQVGRRLKSCLRPSDIVARLGGDEFAVLVQGTTQASEIGAVPNAFFPLSIRPFSSTIAISRSG